MKISTQFTSLLAISFMTLFLASCGTNNTETSASTPTVQTTSTETNTTTASEDTTTPTESTTSSTSAPEEGSETVSEVSTVSEDTIPSENTASDVTASAEETYSQDMTYRGPRSSTTTNFTVTVEGDTIVSASASMVSGNGEDSRYQSSFANQLSSKVVGKTLAEVENLSTIGGASITTDAFKEFISTI